MPDQEPDEVSKLLSDEWVRVKRHDWREDVTDSLKPSAFLRPVKAARLDAIATLRKEAAEAVQGTRPQTKQELEQCLWPAFLHYAEGVCDKMAEAKLSATRPRRSKSYCQWLRSKCLPAVVDDVCRFRIGQFPITVRYVAEMVRDVYWPQEGVRMRQALWGMWA